MIDKIVKGIFILTFVTSACLNVESRRIKRVVGGFIVECGTQPRVVSVRNSTSMEHLCGATLLSHDFALTSAHCVTGDADQYILQLNNVCSDDAPPTAELLGIVTEDSYDKYSRAHDIAILRIKLDLDDVTWLNDDMLPTNSFGISGECIVFGYGNKDMVTMEASEDLLAGKLNIVSLDECTEALGPFVAPSHDGGMMCALGDGVDTCQGDSGSPLICDGGLQAISSYGLSCGVPDMPGVYTSVGAHLPWIRKVMKTERSEVKSNALKLLCP